MSLASKMLLLVLAVCALAACARADCDACIAGLCHSRRPIVTGYPVTDQLAIDRTNNVLYLQFNNNLNTAIFIDDLQSRLVNIMRTAAMAVNQETGVLYLGTQEYNNTYYMYNLIDNKTRTVDTINIKDDDKRKPHLMFSGKYHLHFIPNQLEGINHYNMTDKKLWHMKYLNDYFISDFVIGEDQKMFFVSNDTVYVYLNKNYEHVRPAEVVIRKNHVLSVDKYDSVYLADMTEKVIYKRDKATEKLEKFASYASSAVEDFVFDKDNRIVFRDADGVAQWVPAPAHMRCAFDPQGGFLMKVV